MSDVIKGAGFNIVPGVDREGMNKAEAQIASLITKANKAVEQGNNRMLEQITARLAKATKQDAPTVEVKVDYKVDSANAGIKEIRTLSAGALDPLIKDYKQMVDIQGETAVRIKQEIGAQKQKLADLKMQAQLLDKQGDAYKRNAQQQANVVANTEKLEGVLNKVQTAASLKGQLREASQRLAKTEQYTTKLDNQGRLITTINQKWLAQKTIVGGLQRQVDAASLATQGFGARIAAAGQAMQSAFGWIAAVVAAIAAISGAISRVTGRVKDIQSLKLTFDGLGQSVEAQNAILGSATNIALSYGVSLRKVEGAFRRLGPAILESGGTLKDTEDAIKSIAARTTMLGLNTEQAGRYIEAFAQVMGKGKLQGEELNQQFSELDGGLRGQLKNWLAANKGITDFEGAMKNGEITSGLFLQAFEAINEEVRNKFLRSIGDTQVAIESLGEDGGMTLNQLNAIISTLTSKGMEGLAEAFGPLGKELMKIYAAFVQVFTKVATEMPGLTKLFQVLSTVLGVAFKLVLNTVSVGLGAILGVIDKLILGLEWLLKKIAEDLPAVSGAFQIIGKGLRFFNVGFDKSIDQFSRLSDETVGATSNLEKFNNELKALEEQKGKIPEEEYARKREQLENERHQAVMKNKRIELESAISGFETMLAKRKEQMEQEKTMLERKIEDINKAKDVEVQAIDEVIKALQKQKKETKKVYDEKIEDVKRAYDEEQKTIAASQRALKSQSSAVKQYYDQASINLKAYYSQKKAEMEADHRREMNNLNASIAALRTKQSLESKRLDLGPEARALAKMRASDLDKQASKEKNALRKQELKAEAEAIGLEIERHDMEIQHIKEQAQAEAARRAMEMKHAREKAKLAEEEKKAQEELNRKKQESLDRIAAATESLADQMRRSKEDEKQDIQEIKDEQKSLDNTIQSQLDNEKEKRRAVMDDAKRQVNRLKEEIMDMEREVENVEFAFKDAGGAATEVGTKVDIVTNGALQRMLDKVLRIKTEMANLKVGGGPDSRFAGGPVSGGKAYTVNELGTEGFLSSSGKLSEIKAPAWGAWKAPSTGTVIPAHIWKNVKATQATEARMPRSVNPGNGVARAISTINNSGGDQFNNSVTIQSVNPVQDANNIMVEMARLRRRRFR